MPFFTALLQGPPGTFPGAVEHKSPDGKTAKKIEPVKEGSDIQAGFFDMWLQEHQDADLEQVPADMVMASGSGLDPDITLDNALWQLDRVAAAWAKKTGGNGREVRTSRSSNCCRRRVTPRWAAWSACRWLTCWKSILPCATAIKQRPRPASKVL